MENTTPKKKKSLKSIMLIIAITLSLLGGVSYAGYVLLAGGRTVSTGNARVTTDLFNITATMPGTLERFDIYEGMIVEEGQILGWVQHGETFRSPVDGMVINTNASAGQYILPMVPLATIADINNLHIQANLYETDILDMQLGQPATVTLDSLGSRTLTGYVRNINRITELELAGMPMIVNTGTFRRIIQTVPVEITIIDDVDLSFLIGTNARVSLPVLPTGEGLREVKPQSRTQNQMTATGRVESITSSNVYSSQPLRVSDVLVSLGDTVEAGQILAVLDVADLQSAISTQRAVINQTTNTTNLQAGETRRMLNTAITNRDEEDINLVNARAAVTAANLQLENAQRVYEQVRTDYVNAQNPQILALESGLRTIQFEVNRLTADYNKMTTLYNSGALPRRDLDQMRDILTTVQDQLIDTEVSLRNAREGERRHLEQMRVALDAATIGYQSAIEILTTLEDSINRMTNHEIEALQSALRMTTEINPVESMIHSLAQMERHLEEGVIVSPIEGTITAVHAEAGEFAMMRMFTVENLNHLRILVNVREYDLPSIYVGQEVTATAYATGSKVHTGTITRISPRAIISSAVEFEVEVTITSNYALSPGMTARVNF